MRIALALLVSSVASAAPAPRAVPMQLLDDDVCTLVKSGKDRCAPIAKNAQATVYMSGTKHGIRRVLLAVPNGDRVMVGPSLDYLDAEIESTLVPVTLNGRAGVAVSIAATSDAGTTNQVVGCAAGANGVWKCTQLDLGACTPVIGADGAVGCGTTALTID